MNTNLRMRWPAGKSFAFTIFDDTDDAYLPDIKVVYDFLEDHGFKITKSVWPIKGSETPLIGGTTCENPTYREWLLQLQSKGFEIGFHNATFHTSTRQETLRGIEEFRKLFGHDPYTLANHSGCKESIYWGDARLTGWRQGLYNFLLRNRHRGAFYGHVEASPFFWGDICKTRITYVRNFVFDDINSLKLCPFMPYHDPDRAYVRAWFASSEGPDLNRFARTVSERAQDRLAEEGGACIMYTHLARGFSSAGKVQRRFKQLMERLSRLNGWFVPTKTLLDHLQQQKGIHVITPAERRRLEQRWLLHKIRINGSS